MMKITRSETHFAISLWPRRCQELTVTVMKFLPDSDARSNGQWPSIEFPLSQIVLAHGLSDETLEAYAECVRRAIALYSHYRRERNQ